MSEQEVGETPQQTTTRETIIDERSGFPSSKIDRQWKIVTEIARRGIIHDPEIRQRLLPFCTTPVSETLPHEFMTVLGESDRVAAAMGEKTLGNYLALPSVPDDILTPDLRHTPGRASDSYLEEIAQEFGTDSGLYKSLSLSSRGVTGEEWRMVANRYRFARDVKLLALGAEVLNQNGQFQRNEQGEVVLPSGIRAMVDTAHDSSLEDLLNPQLWEKRTQLKDRVYIIEVNGKKYLLKEKKTARHTDTKKGGHREGRLSEEEFAIAKDFQEHAPVKEGDVTLNWETPVGYAVYPDGFQFALYEYEEGLINSEQAREKITQSILAHPEHVQEEYEMIKKEADKYKGDKRILWFYADDYSTQLTTARGKIRQLARRIGIGKRTPTPTVELTLNDYAFAKAQNILDQALSLLDTSLESMNYVNSDFDGYAFRIPSDQKSEVEILAFDFEYYQKVDPEEFEEREGKADWRKESKLRDGIGFLYWDSEQTQPVTKMQQAAYLALLEKDTALQTEHEVPSQ